MCAFETCSLSNLLTYVLYILAKHESKYVTKLSKRDEEEFQVEELRRKKSIAERLAAFLHYLMMGRVPTPPGKPWIFFLDFLGPRKSGKIGLVLESPGNESLRSWKMKVLDS